MSQSIYAIVPAAGSSRRMKSSTPKLLMKLAGETVIKRTLSNILQIPDLKGVIVPVSKENEAYFREELEVLSPLINIIIGGASRTESVRNGLMALADKAANNDLIIVHDGARCFADRALFMRVIEIASQSGAAVAAVPVVDTLKYASHDVIERDIDRDSLWSIQTPQIFHYDLLVKAYSSANDATDDATLVERFQPVSIVEGSRFNFKITTPDDFKLAETITLL